MRTSNDLAVLQLASRSTPALSFRQLKQPFINIEEKIDKIVGRRTRTPDAFKTGMKLQTLAVELHRSLGHRWARKGVYRFKTHEEAHRWSIKMMARRANPGRRD